MFIIKPVFKSLCMAVLVPGFSSRVLGVIFVSSRSNVWLFVFVPYVEVLVLLLMLHLMIHSASWAQVLPHFCFSYLELCCKFTSHNFFSYGRAAVMRNSLCYRLYSLVWIFQHGWSHHFRSREGECSCYGRFCKACINLIHIFAPIACQDYSSLWEYLETWFITIENSCWVPKNIQWFLFF